MNTRIPKKCPDVKNGKRYLAKGTGVSFFVFNLSISNYVLITNEQGGTIRTCIGSKKFYRLLHWSLEIFYFGERIFLIFFSIALTYFGACFKKFHSLLYLKCDNIQLRIHICLGCKMDKLKWIRCQSMCWNREHDREGDICFIKIRRSTHTHTQIHTNLINSNTCILEMSISPIPVAFSFRLLFL